MTKKDDAVPGDRYTREKGGLFGKGNPGKPKGAKSWANRKCADAARELFETYCPDEIIKLVTQDDNLSVKERMIEWLGDRAYGKAPQTIRTGLDPDSPTAILLRMAGQALPGTDDESNP